jgi:hypothetical protein
MKNKTQLTVTEQQAFADLLSSFRSNVVNTKEHINFIKKVVPPTAVDNLTSIESTLECYLNTIDILESYIHRLEVTAKGRKAILERMYGFLGANFLSEKYLNYCEKIPLNMD